MTTRREFPSPVKREAYQRSGGICECHLIPHVFAKPCGRPLGEGNTFYEHVIEDGAGGDPVLSNCAVLTKTCWRYKTHHYDQQHVADTKRLADRSRNIKPYQWRPMAGTKASGVRKPLRPYSDPVDRRTGLPWRGS
jgi:hypothetical protein